ncbi:hypothetical protein [Oceanibaculum nanhaiense]|uniref:hypothetical protein n=1 Tax=Oceanibaculum nanhaiense TaxID=1909734 RepID=UPI00396D42EC
MSGPSTYRPTDPSSDTAAGRLMSVIERASLSDTYRARLEADPHAMLAEAGIVVARNVEIVIHRLAFEDYGTQSAAVAARGNPQALHLPIPVRPHPALDEIDDTDMGTIIGGVGFVPDGAILDVSQHIAGLLSGSQGAWSLARAS